MPTPAIRLVQNALAALALSALPGVTVSVDRSDDEPFTEDERPALAIRILDVQFAITEYGAQTLHKALVQLDFHSSGATGETIDLVNQTQIARLIAALGNDRTLGDRLQSLEEQSVSGSELDGATVGCAILTLDVQFYTPRGDFFTIVGVGGQTFT